MLRTTVMNINPRHAPDTLPASSEINSHNVNQTTLPEVTDSTVTGVPPIGQKPLGVTEHDTDNLNKPKIKKPAHQQWGRLSGRCIQPC